ncbi:DUF502 domain-containing protein [Magnetococcus sp. PR-3]|uniref:DUF502 domain-containing protein n=1 Tax=Magnetococcus sp. PR-3 TaxID=3120355 RepID=UPI002FCE38E4
MLKRFRVRLKQNFLTGLLVVLPLGVTLFILHLMVKSSDQLLAWLPRAWQPDQLLGMHLPGVGLALTLLLILLVGMVTRNWLGHRLVQWSDQLLGAIPLIRNLHYAVKQFVQTLLGRRAKNFKQVVLLQYPRPGLFAVGLVTSEGEGEVRTVLGEPIYHIFVPTTPNPTSGMLLFVPKNEVINLDMSVEEGLKLVISGGIIIPPWEHDVETPSVQAGER